MNGLVSVAALIGIYATLVFDIFSSTNSSPQTTELFAAIRSSTLWRWVKIGAILSMIFIALGAWLEHKEGRNPYPPIVGGLLALGVMWAMYSYALQKGGGQKPGSAAAYSPGHW